MIAAAAVEDIRGLKPFLVGASVMPAVALALLLCAILAVTYWLLNRRAADPDPVVVVRTQPQRSLRARLDALRDGQLLDSSHSQRFCETLGEIVRDLLSQRLGLPTKRLTTSELVTELNYRVIADEVRERVEVLFATCDLAKFAGASLPASVLSAQLSSAYRLLELTVRTPGAAAGTPS